MNRAAMQKMAEVLLAEARSHREVADTMIGVNKEIFAYRMSASHVCQSLAAAFAQATWSLPRDEST